jgi:hypothetical protein
MILKFIVLLLEVFAMILKSLFFLKLFINYSYAVSFIVISQIYQQNPILLFEFALWIILIFKVAHKSTIEDNQNLQQL